MHVWREPQLMQKVQSWWAEVKHEKKDLLLAHVHMMGTRCPANLESSSRQMVSTFQLPDKDSAVVYELVPKKSVNLGTF